MMETTIVNNKGHNRTDRDLYIGRGSIFGNEWSHLDSSKAMHTVPTRAESIFHYADWLVNGTDDHAAQLRSMILHYEELRGMVMVCYCKPDACHGDILAAAVNRVADIRENDPDFDTYDDGERYTQLFSAAFDPIKELVEDKRDEYGPRCGCKYHRFDNTSTGEVEMIKYWDPHAKEELTFERDKDDEKRYQRLLGLRWNWHVQLEHGSIYKSSSKTIKCDRCGGSGQVLLHINDKTGAKKYGTCFRCQGKGNQTRSDFYRNDKHDRFCPCLLRD